MVWLCPKFTNEKCYFHGKDDMGVCNRNEARFPLVLYRLYKTFYIVRHAEQLKILGKLDMHGKCIKISS